VHNYEGVTPSDLYAYVIDGNDKKMPSFLLNLKLRLHVQKTHHVMLESSPYYRNMCVPKIHLYIICGRAVAQTVNLLPPT
jgi:hypothetical protein